MASVRYGALVTDLVGKINGQNFQRGLATPRLRNISTRRSFQGTIQFANYTPNTRATFTYVTQYWKSLTTAQQTAWSTAASSFPRLNKFGVTYIPSGYQLFCEFNFFLVIVGRDVLTVPPATSTFVAPTWALVYYSGVPSLVLTQSGTFTASPYYTAIYASTYQSNGLGLVKGRLKMLTVYLFTSIDTDLDIYALFTALYGTPSVGQSAWFSVQQFNNDSGESTTQQYFKITF
jgi:hypothetical protein